MKLQTNKRPYNTIGEVHHITMDKQEFDYLTLSIKSTTALHYFMKEYNKYKLDAFVEEKFVVVITPDDCEKPDHRMSFAFFGKINQKYIDKFNEDFEKRANRWSDNTIPKSPMVYIYCANTDRFRKVECTIIVPEDTGKNILVEGPAIANRNGYRGMFESSNTAYYGTSYAESQLLETLTEGKQK